ncbi:alpha/beta hydrolase [Sneathiella limimaris]|uniref:alpha/beta hydrolase n=1 Tax=Sneathiella limimaris TaxID=1964213 RepID=UPI00146BB39D|nr:alpha/beta hydrolase [Sneathiella limimaris]
MTVYKSYDQPGLDAEYNNQAKVHNFKNFVTEWNALSQTARDEFPNHVSVVYDPSSNQSLDLFYPVNEGTSPAPVQVFFHGGYWKAFTKESFHFVARAFAHHGIATAIVDYQLIPNIDMAELIRQCRQSLAYLYEQAEQLKINGNEINISGHSAGGHIVAMCLASDWAKFGSNLPKDLVKSAVGLSGLYDLEPISKCFLQQDLNLTISDVETLSPIHLDTPKNGVFLPLVGAEEGPEYIDQSERLASKWQNCSKSAGILAPYNHFTIMSAFAEPSSGPAQQVRNLMKTSS